LKNIKNFKIYIKIKTTLPILNFLTLKKSNINKKQNIIIFENYNIMEDYSLKNKNIIN
jgi:hypothetical protein